MSKRRPPSKLAVAGNGVAVNDKAKKLQPELILLDLSMPVLGGAEAASILKKTMPNTKIILFSMHVNDIPKSVAKAIGVDLALSKSDGITKLGEHLKSLLAPQSTTEDSTSEPSKLLARCFVTVCHWREFATTL